MKNTPKFNLEQFHNSFQWRQTNVTVYSEDGGVLFEAKSILVPHSWGQNAVNMLVSKYFRKAGVPTLLEKVKSEEDKDVPEWLLPSQPADGAETGMETSALQVFHRLAGCWTYWGFKYKELRYFENEKEAIDFYKQTFTDLYMQRAAPNSPQWFNTGLSWAYGISLPTDGAEYYSADPVTGKVTKLKDAFLRPQSQACYILGIEDNLVGKDGILEHTLKEGRIFKNGSGAGANYSHIRGKDEPLSGGGYSSGLMSFLKIPDTSSGAIKSGGTTRRSARMVLVNADHPEVEPFVKWKSDEEYKAASLITGSKVMSKLLDEIYNAETVEEENAAIRQCRDLGVPETYVAKALDAKSQGMKLPIEEFDVDWRGAAYASISGQNSNNSVPVPNSFMKKVLGEDSDYWWELTARTTGQPIETVDARKLFQDMAENTWISGDPGILFKDTINEWHTCPEDGEIEGTNPCSEYQFLNNTSCNLASLNVVKFWSNGKFLYNEYIDAARRWTKVLELAVLITSAPSEEIARQTYRFRTLGLGYANIGALLMRIGVPYDSEEGRAVISMHTSLLAGAAYYESSLMAKSVGPFSGFQKNRKHMLDVIHNHAIAAGIPGDYSERLTVKPRKIDWASIEKKYPDAYEANLNIWNSVIESGEKNGFRNAQTVVIAPTGTISFTMGCDTTGIEPDYSLVKYKSLAGGGTIKIANESIPAALEKLGYSSSKINDITKYVEQHETVEGAPHLKDAHLPIFDCANTCGKIGKRYLRPESHVLSMAAAQPFVSGSISKTVNLPRSASVEDVKNIFILAYRSMVKSIATYRDMSKMNQPLSSNKRLGVYSRVGKKNVEHELASAKRRPLPTKRRGYTQKAKVGGHKLYIRTGEYENGSLGEIFLDLGKEGTQTKAWAAAFAISVSLGLQYGVPLEEYVDAFIETKFEPNGTVMEHPDVRMTQSMIDLIFRDLAINYLGRDDYSHSKTAEKLQKRFEGIKGAREIIEAEQVDEQDGEVCPNCASGRIVQTGTCKTCSQCGYSLGGCG